MKPRKVEYECGETRFKNTVTLEISISQGQEEISITKQAASQRDDTQRIFGLTRDNIFKMAEALQNQKNIA
jgi:hypothetical protein